MYVPCRHSQDRCRDAASELALALRRHVTTAISTVAALRARSGAGVIVRPFGVEFGVARMREPWLLVGIMMCCMAGCGGKDGTTTGRPEAGTVLPLPSNGWRDGDPVMLGTTDGRLHATAIGDTACAWIGDNRGPFTWPE